jgi:phospholipid/cholesterol/gamma-HCH transport system ATP-binding protein
MPGNDSALTVGLLSRDRSELNAEPSPSAARLSGPPVIEVTDLHTSYDGRSILKGVNLTIHRGETMVIMGGSGCGKSTFLRHLIGSSRPDRGSVRLWGVDLVRAKEEDLNKIRRRFGILFQSGALYNSMSVFDNVALPLREHTDLEEDIIEITVKIKLELVGLRDFDHLMPAQLSGGMKKRVGLARAIALDPEILFYDEPSAGLDPVVSGVIDTLIIDLSRKLGVTSVVVTHEMDSAFRIADRMCMLHEGRVVALGTKDEIRNTSDPLVRQFVYGLADGPIPLRRSRSDYAADLMGARIG